MASMQVGSGDVEDPKGKAVVDAVAPAPEPAGSLSSSSSSSKKNKKKNRRRQNKPAAASGNSSSSSAAAVAAVLAAPVPSCECPLRTLFNAFKEVFANSEPGFVPPPDAVARLSAMLNGLEAGCLGLEARMPYLKNPYSKRLPRVTYLHFFECSKFSFGVFCLPKSAVIPLHNHPGMTVFSKVLIGSMHIKSYDWVRTPQGSDDTLKTSSGDHLAKLNTDGVFGTSTDTIVLYPEIGNFHCFTAVTPCAVFDVMGPPYSHEEGRDCTFYDAYPYSSPSGGKEMPGGDGQYAWLKQVPSTFTYMMLDMQKVFQN